MPLEGSEHVTDEEARQQRRRGAAGWVTDAVVNTQHQGRQMTKLTSLTEAMALADENKARGAVVTLGGRTIYEVSLLDQPSDTEVTDAVDLLGLKPHEVPEGFASWNGNALVRLPKAMGDVLTASEARAWAELLLRGADDAESAVEEQVRDAEAA